MRKASLKTALALGSILLFNMYAANATSIPNRDDPTTFLGPTAKGAYTSTLNDITAYSVAGEAGLKNFRAGGTLAWKIENNQRIKVSAEYLWQKLTYSFFSGNTDQWVNQGAIGAAYQYDLDYDYKPQLDMNVYVSHAPSKSLHTVAGTFINKQGALLAFADNRHIAGSNGIGASPGITFQPWMGNKTGIDLNYDNVRYNKNYSPNEDAKGFGGTVHIKQALYENFQLNLLAAVRQPFNNYQAGLAWSQLPWTLGVDGAYTVGKNTLPNSYNVSLSASFALDRRCETPGRQNLKGDMKGEAPMSRPVNDGLVGWAADPAVYMPEVLAIPDEKLTFENVPVACGFGIPTFSGVIPNGNTSGGGATVTINTAAFFTGTNLTFSIAQSKAPSPGNTLTFNTTTGVLTATGPATDTITVTVTATNPCGSATSNTFSIIY